MKELINKLAERLRTETAQYIGNVDYYLTEYRTRRRIKALNDIKKETLRANWLQMAKKYGLLHNDITITFTTTSAALTRLLRMTALNYPARFTQSKSNK